MVQAQNKYDVLKATSITLQLGVEDIVGGTDFWNDRTLKKEGVDDLDVVRLFCSADKSLLTHSAAVVARQKLGMTRANGRQHGVSMVSAYRFPKRVNMGKQRQSTSIRFNPLQSSDSEVGRIESDWQVSYLCLSGVLQATATQEN